MVYVRRSIAVVTLTVVVGFVLAISWRQWFPFPDRLAPYVPPDALAYVHVNLTPYTRRALADLLAQPTITASMSGDLRTALARAIERREVRELGFIVLPTRDPRGVRIAIAVGQSASRTPDVLDAMTSDVGGIPVRIATIRWRADSSPATPWAASDVLRVVPLQARMTPRAIAFHARFPTAAERLPEAMAFGGAIHRSGIVFDSQPIARVRIPRSLAVREIPNAGEVVVKNVPFHALLAFDGLPDALRALRGSLDDRLDARVRLSDGAWAVRGTVRSDARITEGALRAIAAYVWPMRQSRTLDGLHALVEVADPSAMTFTRGADRWVIGHASGDALGTAWWNPPQFTLVSQGDPTRSAPTFDMPTLPRMCGNDRDALLVLPVERYPQGFITSISGHTDRIQICALLTSDM